MSEDDVSNECVGSFLWHFVRRAETTLRRTAMESDEVRKIYGLVYQVVLAGALVHHCRFKNEKNR